MSVSRGKSSDSPPSPSRSSVFHTARALPFQLTDDVENHGFGRKFRHLTHERHIHGAVGRGEIELFQHAADGGGVGNEHFRKRVERVGSQAQAHGGRLLLNVLPQGTGVYARRAPHPLPAVGKGQTLELGDVRGQLGLPLFPGAFKTKYGQHPGSRRAERGGKLLPDIRGKLLRAPHHQHAGCGRPCRAA